MKRSIFFLDNELFDYLHNASIRPSELMQEPFIYKNYSPNKYSQRQYFSNENALRIDFIRQKIEEWKNKDFLNTSEYFYLLASLLESIPFISNIAGTYGAYLKHWDRRALKKIQLSELRIIENKKNNRCFNKNSNELIREISGDMLYIDPPYNSRQYAPNYHILETIAKYDNPLIYGKSGMRPYGDKKSNYCIKDKAANTLIDLIENANFKHILLSYSTEGIISVSEIEDILKKYARDGSYELVKIPYRRYKHTPKDIEHNLYELLFYIHKMKK
ncbi:DNA adenine methylase [Helicobacter cappadocius]|uniref:site-specific DNA-methyltransferase (adenine-specific) n=2 Tax=Helicobacter cappadocius TaxID=3063998 RepID=A0AA90PJL5_9HELI|nr:DNA adenine methylase [Helicobacter sp. faydin-H75]MDO7253164.1 DNA adenine methylase [Helicobacter sp. faydin-H75]MDP2538710.1 DNA adenine methylase [Helicobacter sp. faydin-H76]